MIRRIFANRFVRALLWIFITFVTLLVLLLVWTNWSGKRRWAASKAMVEEQGETFDFYKLLPETPPEAQNLLAIEPLHGLTEVIEDDENKGEPGAKRKALRALDLPTPWAKVPPLHGAALGQATDTQGWITYLQESKFLDLPASSPPPSARDVLAALDAKFPVLKQLADESMQRPQARFIPDMRQRQMPRLLLAIRIPHYSLAQSLGRALALRARMAVAAGDSAAATRTIVALSSLAQACEQEPMLIGFLVGSTVDVMVIESLWLGLRQHVFTGEDLQHLRHVLENHNIPAAFLGAMRGEMAAGLNAVEHLQMAAAKGRADGDMRDLLRSMTPGINQAVSSLVPSGLFDHWKSAMAEMELRHLIQPLKDGGLMQAVLAGDAVQEEIRNSSNVLLHPDLVMVRLMIPAVAPISMHALLGETRRRQALTAIALEQFFAKHARYPGQLNELVPEFLPSVPLDPCDDKPLRYTTTSSGLFSLWSVAVDRKDDTGKVTVDSKGSPKLNKRDYLGDWTWQYESVK